MLSEKTFGRYTDNEQRTIKRRRKARPRGSLIILGRAFAVCLVAGHFRIQGLRAEPYLDGRRLRGRPDPYDSREDQRDRQDRCP